MSVLAKVIKHRQDKIKACGAVTEIVMTKLDKEELERELEVLKMINIGPRRNFNTASPDGQDRIFGMEIKVI